MHSGLFSARGKYWGRLGSYWWRGGTSGPVAVPPLGAELAKTQALFSNQLLVTIVISIGLSPVSFVLN